MIKYENFSILRQGIHTIESEVLHDIILKENYIVIFISLSFVDICQNYIGFVYS